MIFDFLKTSKVHIKPNQPIFSIFKINTLNKKNTILNLTFNATLFATDVSLDFKYLSNLSPFSSLIITTGITIY